LINDYNRSGSCAIAVIVMDSICYVANLGDSRALLSEGASRRIFQITQDHKPNDPEEKERINKNGGYIYQSAGCKDISDAPWRIFPGKLSVNIFNN
jgi:protein phosphatase 2C family protein 2/3